jgi:hypothetical protein
VASLGDVPDCTSCATLDTSDLAIKPDLAWISDQALGAELSHLLPETHARELMALIGRVHDSYANLWSSLDVRPPTGRCELPALVRFVENSALVTGVTGGESGATGLQVGDVIVELDGAAPRDTAAKLAPYYASSNDASRLRDFACGMTRGDCTPATLRVRRDGRTLSLTVARTPTHEAQHLPWHDRAGPTFQKLSDDVAYLKLSSVRRADVAGYLQAAAGVRGLVVRPRAPSSSEAPPRARMGTSPPSRCPGG